MKEKTNEKELDEQVDTPEKEIDDSKVSEEKYDKKDKKLKEKINELEKEVATWKNKYYQAYADMDNLRKLMEKDHQQMVKYCGQGFLEALLPVFDNFYMAFKVKPSDPTLEAYCKGFEMIYNQMVSCLESEGVSEIFPKAGDKFDHNKMQAVDVVEGEEDDVIVQIANKGYMYKDRLVRPAMVVVSKVKKEEQTDSSEKLN
ncbi:MAG: nucleotide exchange factor GrpE [Bacillales bacterium]|nr:nucleotide exchange factor GrpE [Bacillales bacterium]